MNDFKKYRLLEAHRNFDDVLNETVNTYAPVLTESVNALSESVQSWNRFVLNEELSQNEIAKIFQTLSDTRGKGDIGLADKASIAADSLGVKAKELQQQANATLDKAKTATGSAKDELVAKAKELQAKAKEAGAKVLDKGKQLAGDMKQKFNDIKTSISSQVSKAKGMIPKDISAKLQAGGEAAKEATEFVGQKVDDAVAKASSALSKSVGGKKVVSTVNKIGEYAKENPMKAAIALAAISALTGAAIGTAGMGAAGGGVVSFVSKVALNMIKGEDAASAAKKAAKSGMLGAATGGLGGALADYLGGLFSDIDTSDAAVASGADAESGTVDELEGKDITDSADAVKDFTEMLAQNPGSLVSEIETLVNNGDMSANDVKNIAYFGGRPRTMATFLQNLYPDAEIDQDDISSQDAKVFSQYLKKAFGDANFADADVDTGAEAPDVNPGNDKGDFDSFNPDSFMGDDEIDPENEVNQDRVHDADSFDPDVFDAEDEPEVNPGNDKGDFDSFNPDSFMGDDEIGAEPEVNPGNDKGDFDSFNPDVFDAEDEVDAEEPEVNPGNDKGDFDSFNPDVFDAEDEPEVNPGNDKGDFDSFNPDVFDAEDEVDAEPENVKKNWSEMSDEEKQAAADKQTIEIADNRKAADAIMKGNSDAEPTPDQAEMMQKNYKRLKGFGMSDEQIFANLPGIEKHISNESSDMARILQLAGVSSLAPVPTLSRNLNESVVPAQRGTRNAELDRIRELAGLAPLNEGPWDAVKKVAQKGKDLAQSGVQAVKGKEALSADKLQRLWKENGSPTDEQEFMKFLKGIGVTDKEIRAAMGAVPGSDAKLDPKSKARLEKIVGLVNQLGVADEIKTHLATTELETNESRIFEEIDTPGTVLHDKTVLMIFQALEKKLPELKSSGQEEPEAEEPNQAKPENLGDHELTGQTDEKTGKPKARAVTAAESIRIINKLVEHYILGRSRI